MKGINKHSLCFFNCEEILHPLRQKFFHTQIFTVLFIIIRMSAISFNFILRSDKIIFRFFWRFLDIAISIELPGRSAFSVVFRSRLNMHTIRKWLSRWVAFPLTLQAIVNDIDNTSVC